MESSEKRLKVDLRELREPWLAWCRARGTTPGDAFRQVVAKLLAQGRGGQGVLKPVTGEAEKPTVKKKVSLTPSEATAIDAAARLEGFSSARWVVATLRARLTATPQFGQAELDALTGSNAALLAIGRNLNQIAKALNTTPHERLLYRVEQIEEVHAAIKEHTRLVSLAMTANVERWRIE